MADEMSTLEAMTLEEVCRSYPEQAIVVMKQLQDKLRDAEKALVMYFRLEEERDELKVLLQLALKEIEAHNSDYHHCTPDELIDNIKKEIGHVN